LNNEQPKPSTEIETEYSEEPIASIIKRPIESLQPNIRVYKHEHVAFGIRNIIFRVDKQPDNLEQLVYDRSTRKATIDGLKTGTIEHH